MKTSRSISWSAAPAVSRTARGPAVQARSAPPSPRASPRTEPASASVPAITEDAWDDRAPVLASPAPQRRSEAARAALADYRARGFAHVTPGIAADLLDLARRSGATELEPHCARALQVARATSGAGGLIGRASNAVMGQVMDLVDRGRCALLWNFGSRSIATSAGRMHVLVAENSRGASPPAVVLHGLASGAADCAPLLSAAAAECAQVIAPDMLGHGFSEIPPDLDMQHLVQGMVEALDRLIDRPAVIFGNSMGGWGAVLFALARPEKVLGLFLASPGGGLNSGGELMDLLSTFRIGTHADALDFVERLGQRTPVIRHFVAAGVRSRFARPHLQGLLDKIVPGDFLKPEDLARLRCPVMVCWGAKDEILPRAQRDCFKAIPGVVIVDPERWGHSPLLDDPADVSRRFLEFARACGEAQATPA